MDQYSNARNSRRGVSGGLTLEALARQDQHRLKHRAKLKSRNTAKYFGYTVPKKNQRRNGSDLP